MTLGHHYYAPSPAEGQALPKAVNGQGWAGWVLIFFLNLNKQVTKG